VPVMEICSVVVSSSKSAVTLSTSPVVLLLNTCMLVMGCQHTNSCATRS
jgi:hypothetical protein